MSDDDEKAMYERAFWEARLSTGEMSINDLKKSIEKAQAIERALTQERDRLGEALKAKLTPEQYQQFLAESERVNDEREALLETLSQTAKRLAAEPESKM